MSKTQRRGFLVLLFLILLIELGFYFLSIQKLETTALTQEEKAWLNSVSSQQENLGAYTYSAENKKKEGGEIIYQNFNPNVYTAKDWEKIGFSEKQSKSIVKYKYSLGGNFKHIDELKKCFVISEAKFNKMKPYIRLSPVRVKNNQWASKNEYEIREPKENKVKKIKLTPFDPNQLTREEWMALGFSEKQSHVILNYKNKILKGKFTALEQIKNCYVISLEKYQELKPYIILQEIDDEELPKVKQQVTESLKHKNINKLSLEDWMALGATENQAENILKYKEFINGFKNEEDLKKCEFVTPEIRLKVSSKGIIF